MFSLIVTCGSTPESTSKPVPSELAQGSVYDRVSAPQASPTAPLYLCSGGEYLSNRVSRCLDYLAYRDAKRRFAPVLLDNDSSG